MKWLCECGSYHCTESIELTVEDAVEILHRELIAIADGCPHGAEATDELVEEREGYKLYREVRG